MTNTEDQQTQSMNQTSETDTKSPETDTKSSFKDSCPVFSDGCPWTHSSIDLDLKTRCPAFENGCPFQFNTIEAIYEKLSELPESHRVQGDRKMNDASAAVDQFFQQVHKVSVEKKAEVGECPVFATSCPFKTVCSNGQLLVSELDFATWGIDLDAVSPEASPDQALSKYIKKGTRVSHRKAENVHFVRSVIKGTVDRKLYILFVVDLYYVYRALEEAADECKHKLFTPLHFDVLRRLPSLEQDLAYYMGSNWKSLITPSPATAQYVQRIKQIAAESPELLLAHTYTRYLGDLSGGQVLKRCVIKALGEGGTSFYDFSGVPDSRKFKKKYRSILDALPVSAKTADALVAEANVAFELNTKLFQELDVLAGHQVKEPTPIPVNLSPAQTSAEPCPFAAMARALGLSNPHAAEHSAPASSAGPPSASSSTSSAQPSEQVIHKEGSFCPYTFTRSLINQAGRQQLLSVLVLALALSVGVLVGRLM